jgi:hypothetical protein
VDLTGQLSKVERVGHDGAERSTSAFTTTAGSATDYPARMMKKEIATYWQATPMIVRA